MTRKFTNFRFDPKLALVLKIVVSFISFLVVARSISWVDVGKVFSQVQIGWVVIALAVFWIAQVGSALRCVYIARALGGNLDLSTSVRAHFIGLWFNQVLPTSLGGDVVKVATLRKTLGLSIALRSAILDRFSGLLFLMIAIAVTLPFYWELFTESSLVYALALLSMGFLIAVGLFSWGASYFQQRFIRFPWLIEPLKLLSDIWSFRSTRRLWEQFWTSAIVHFNGIVTYALLGLALGVRIDFLTFILIVPLVFLVALLPISFAGWGVREVGSVWLFGMVGVAKESALAMSIAFGLVLIIAGLPGLPYIFRRNVTPALGDEVSPR